MNGPMRGGLQQVRFIGSRHGWDQRPRWVPIGLFTSAKTGVDIPELIRRIVMRLVPAAPPPGAAIPFTAEQVAAIEVARDSIERGRCADGIDALVRLVRWPDGI